MRANLVIKISGALLLDALELCSQMMSQINKKIGRIPHAQQHTYLWIHSRRRQHPFIAAWQISFSHRLQCARFGRANHDGVAVGGGSPNWSRDTPARGFRCVPRDNIWEKGSNILRRSRTSTIYSLWRSPLETIISPYKDHHSNHLPSSPNAQPSPPQK